MNKDFINNINHSIKKLFAGKIRELYPLFYSPRQFNKNAELLFIGMNPAGTEKDGYYKIGKGFTKEGIKSIIDESADFTSYKPYYKVYGDHFGEWDKSNWNIIDLFVIRGTNQKAVIQKRIEDSDFFFQQYKEIFLPLLKELKPKVIVVTNAAASSILKNLWYGDNSEINENGYWNLPKSIKFKGSDKTKILFTSMLSGQRAMDIHTRELLKWNIARLLVN